MKKIAKIILLACVVGLIMVTSSCNEKKQSPNFIMIMADDLGWGDTGFNGNEIVKTPNLDLMASSGVIFQRFYSASSVCSPTRASCLTGRNPYRIGIPNANSGHMLESETTIAEVLKEEGYATGHFGKWHLGTFTNEVKDANRGKPGIDTHLSIPSQHGFDVFFSTESKVPTWDPAKKPKDFDSALGESLRYGWIARSNDETKDYGTRYWIGKNQEVVSGLDGDDTKVIMDQALEFITQQAETSQSFYAVIWTHTPHLPVVADKESMKKYSGLGFKEELYYACISNLDIQMGRLWNKLEDLDIKDNTCIFFCSDNGPERGTPGSATPFRGQKRELYEGGVRVPAFVIWPDKFDSDRSIDYPAFTSDYYPTILEILDIPNPHNNTLDGISILSAIKGESIERLKPMGFRYPKRQSWVTNSHKLISVDNGESYELYNLLTDPYEQNNIIDQEMVLATKMQSEIEEWIKDVDIDYNIALKNE